MRSAILNLAFSFTNLRENLRMARPEAAHNPLKNALREVVRDLRARFRMNCWGRMARILIKCYVKFAIM